MFRVSSFNRSLRLYFQRLADFAETQQDEVKGTSGNTPPVPEPDPLAVSREWSLPMQQPRPAPGRFRAARLPMIK